MARAEVSLMKIRLTEVLTLDQTDHISQRCDIGEFSEEVRLPPILSGGIHRMFPPLRMG